MLGLELKDMGVVVDDKRYGFINVRASASQYSTEMGITLSGVLALSMPTFSRSDPRFTEEVLQVAVAAQRQDNDALYANKCRFVFLLSFNDGIEIITKAGGHLISPGTGWLADGWALDMFAKDPILFPETGLWAINGWLNADVMITEEMQTKPLSRAYREGYRQVFHEQEAQGLVYADTNGEFSSQKWTFGSDPDASLSFWSFSSFNGVLMAAIALGELLNPTSGPPIYPRTQGFHKKLMDSARNYTGESLYLSDPCCN